MAERKVKDEYMQGNLYALACTYSTYAFIRYATAALFDSNKRNDILRRYNIDNGADIRQSKKDLRKALEDRLFNSIRAKFEEEITALVSHNRYNPNVKTYQFSFDKSKKSDIELEQKLLSAGLYLNFLTDIAVNLDSHNTVTVDVNRKTHEGFKREVAKFEAQDYEVKERQKVRFTEIQTDDKLDSARNIAVRNTRAQPQM